MARLELFLLGPPRLEREGVPLHFDTRKILALVAYVAVTGLESQGRHLTRDSLVALLWPELEPRRARAVFRRNLSILRSALQGEWLVADRQTLSTDPQADFWLDVSRFRHLVHLWQTHGHPPDMVCARCLADLEEAAALYQGDFLEGFGLRDSAAYDDWQFFQAEGLRQELGSALQRLMRGYSALGNHEAALPHARRWLALDPLHEPAHRLLMQLYLAAGQRSAALRQYQDCARLLDEELGLAPDEETTALYERIRTTPPGSDKPGPLPVLVGAPELPARAAPPRHNLPAQTTPFVGREEELVETLSRLRDPACRVLTLLGPGGIGKTRLALRLAENLVEANSFEHGVFFVPLTSLKTAEGVVPAVAEALGFAFHAEAEADIRPTPRQQLLDYLRRRQLLLVMDNYEHLLVNGALRDSEGGGQQGVAFLSEMLSAAPGLKLLVTSRARLLVQGEHLYPLAGLRIPEAALPASVDVGQALRRYSAAELFVQGARRARPDYELRAQDWAPVARICRLVQGMPLGILLAAAWVEMLTPEAIAAEIQQTLDFLETDLRDVPLRQRSIRAAFDHSWRLLDEREREVFQALSVFCGGLTREAAREVVGASLRDLMSLVDKSLLVAPRPGRYEMHEVLRQYAAERLAQAPDQGNAVRDRHCAYYVAALARWAAELRGPGQQQAMEEMDLEIENCRAAWYWAVAQGQVASLAQGADGIWLYHDWRLRHEEGEAAFRAAVRGLESIDSPEAQRLRARCLILWSHFQLDLARKEPSIEAAEEGLHLLQALDGAGHDVRPEMALAAFHQARLKRYYCPDPLEAKELYAQSVALYEEVGDRWGLAQALAHLGWMAEQLGYLDEAQALCQRSLAIRQDLGDQRGLADAMRYLGIISWVQGHLDEALSLFRESLGISRKLDDWIRIAQTLKSIGEVLVRRGQYEDGLAMMEGSIDIFEEMVYAFGVSGVLPFLAEAKVHLGLYAEARADAAQGAARAGQVKHCWGVAFSRFVDGLAALAQGNPNEALRLLDESASTFSEVRHRENRGWVLGPLGLAALLEGKGSLARRYIHEGLEIGAELRTYMPVLYGLPAAARLLASQGEAEAAVEAYACALRHDFAANSRWFEDVAGRHVANAAAALPAAVAEAARERGRALPWDEMAARLLPQLLP